MSQDRPTPRDSGQDHSYSYGIDWRLSILFTGIAVAEGLYLSGPTKSRQKMVPKTVNGPFGPYICYYPECAEDNHEPKKEWHHQE